MVPARREAFVLDAERLGARLLEEIERAVVEDREVFGRVAGADAGLVLMHGDIQDPVEAVFDGPMTAHGAGEEGRVGGQAGDAEAGFVGGAVADGPRAIHAQDAAHAGPAGPIGQPGQVVGGPRAAHLAASMVAVHGLRRGVGNALAGVGLGVREEQLSHTVETAAQEIAALVLVSALLATERARAAAGHVPVLRVSFGKVLELVKPMWLIVQLGDGLVTDRIQQQMLKRAYALMGHCLTPVRRARTCPRAVRQPVTRWPRLLRTQSIEGPWQCHVI